MNPHPDPHPDPHPHQDFFPDPHPHFSYVDPQHWLRRNKENLRPCALQRNMHNYASR
jgi:hypothetical protein